jgi:hypothetical protein
MDRKTKENLMIAADLANEKQEQCKRKYHFVFSTAAITYVIHIMMVRYDGILQLDTSVCDFIEGMLLGISLGCLLFGSCMTAGYLDRTKKSFRKKWQ